MNKKGFSLLELISVIFVLSLAFILAIPKILKLIENYKYDAFVAGVKNTIDAIDLYIAKNDFVIIPEEGMYIEDLDDDALKNNNYDSGMLYSRKEQVEVVNLKMGNYCATGTKDNLITTDKGCGALDETSPEKINIFVKNETTDYLYLVIGGYDPDSEIIKYELSIDNEEYYSNSNENSNVFKIKKDGKNHYYKAKITNEGNLSLESDLKTFESETETIICTKNEVKSTLEVTCNLENALFEDETQENSNLFSTNDNLKITSSLNDIDINILSIDSLLNDSVPVLEDSMIPVIYDGEKWVVASRESIYWDYEKKNWANAVITRKNSDISDPDSKSREYYLSDEAIGEEINPNDIIGYYVWIPKYSYEAWNTAGVDKEKEDKGVKLIDISFDDTNIHQAFLYSETETGFWVSKYEAGVSSETSCGLESTVYNCNTDKLDLLFKDNISILKNISISNAYNAIINLNSKINVSNPHLITNLEWGAIAYLSHSKYGIGTNIESETTTGNVTGVYNMGVNTEFVMGNFNNDLGYDDNDNSGFEELPNYIDIYKSSNVKGRFLGDATGETETWYNSTNNFINGNYPFIIRGTNSIFDFSNSSGSASDDITFRMVTNK